jgi:hypothetical protein
MSLDTVVNKLIDLIKSQYPRFGDTDRILFAPLEFENLGYEDVITIEEPVQTTAVNLSRNDKINNYVVKLNYYKKIVKDSEKYDVVSFAESLDSYLMEHRHESGYWTSLETSTTYDIELEDYAGKIAGFEMEITFIVYRS